MNEEELKKEIKEAYKDSGNVKHHTKVYVTILIVIVICIVAYLFLFGGFSSISDGTRVTNQYEALKGTSDIGASINDMSDELQNIEDTLG